MEQRKTINKKLVAIIAGITTGDIMLSDVWELNELYLSDRGISNIDALSGLTNLTHLALSENNISDYSPVSFVPNLLRY